ncbi:KUP system potassium uptake protein [Pedobacter sp. UYP30]|uniref:potassium transporter Kup n=1 Tax=Pedobacter sp. UYP30 TaxID=1756400 RepID=UPI00339A9F55
MTNNSKQTKSNLSIITLGALGIVFGDIGTSPLYAMKECFFGEHGMKVSEQNIFGVVSLIFWSLIFVISIKYLLIVMKADNKGEGGIMALMELVLPKKKGRSYLTILSLGLFGAALLYGDGIITPAISVLSAMEGLEIATPLFKPFIIPATIIILFFLFFFQKKGTASVGKIFGPILLLWFIVLAALGFSAIFKNPTILKALNPIYFIEFFTLHGFTGLLVLGAVFLVVTGGEALYADMGHFGRKPIRLAWFLVVLPSLVINYMGQGALILSNHHLAANPFYYLAPSWALYPLVVLSAMATVIASQAVISGAFSLTHQAIQLGFLPRFHVIHTSADERGQIYIPQINWMLFIATIALVISFKSSSNLAAAYGVAVTTTMLITTFLAFTAMTKLWKWNFYIAVSITLFFTIIDLSFFYANIIKIPDGGWFPLLVGILIYVLMTTWYKGRRMLGIKLTKLTDPLKKFIINYKKDVSQIVPGTAFFLTANPNGTPPTLVNNIKYNKVIHEKVIIMSIKIAGVPYLDLDDHIEINKLDGNIWQVLVNYGFMQQPDIPKVIELLCEQDLISDKVDIVYFLGKESIVITKNTGMSPWRESLFDYMSRNSERFASYFNLPSEQVCEIGTQIRL